MPTDIELQDDQKQRSNGLKVSSDVIKWLLMIAFSAGMIYASIKFETQTHSDETYLKKEVFDEVQRSSDANRSELIKRLDRIEEKIDRLTEKRK